MSDRRTTFESQQLDNDYEAIGGRFAAQFPGTCTIDDHHLIKRKDLVTRVQRISNPFVVVPGVACAGCTKVLPRA